MFALPQSWYIWRISGFFSPHYHVAKKVYTLKYKKLLNLLTTLFFQHTGYNAGLATAVGSVSHSICIEGEPEKPINHTRR